MKNIKDWNTAPPCSLKEIKKIVNELGIEFDSGYKEFLLWSDGGEGYIGYNYISLWSLSSLVQLNKDYQIKKYLGDKYFVFGTNGNNICYGFDFLNSGSIFTLSLEDLDQNEIIILAKDFDDFINRAKKEKLN